mgnify:CR=1 FL=1
MYAGRIVELGRVEVRQVYKITGVGTVAGCYVLEGKITRNAEIRVVRDGIIIADDKLASLKRFKDDVKEVAKGYECGTGSTSSTTSRRATSSRRMKSRNIANPNSAGLPRESDRKEGSSWALTGLPERKRTSNGS